MRHFVAVALAFCLCVPATWAQHKATAEPPKSNWETLADGAVVVATMRYNSGKSEQKTEGDQLVRFALKINPEHAKALVLQGKVERGLELEKVSLTDGGAAYAELVVKAAQAAKNDGQRLMLYKLVEILQPANETALIELTKAKNKGIDVSFDGLLADFSTNPAKVVKTAVARPDDRPAEAPNTAGDKPAPAAGKDGDGDEMEKKLQAITVPDFDFNLWSPVENINLLARVLAARNIQVDVQATKLPVRRYSDGMNGPANFWLDGAGGAAIARGGGWERQPPIKNATAGEVMRKICRTFTLGCKYDGNKVVFVDPDDAASITTIGYALDAEQLAKQFKLEGVKGLSKYATQKIELRGEVTGLGKAMSSEFIELVGGKIRVFAGKNPPKDWDKLREVVRASKDDNRKNKKEGGSGSGYYTTTASGKSVYHSYNPNTKIIFYGTCRFSRTEMNRVELRDCENVSWTTQEGNAD